MERWLSERCCANEHIASRNQARPALLWVIAQADAQREARRLSGTETDSQHDSDAGGAAEQEGKPEISAGHSQPIRMASGVVLVRRNSSE